MFKIITENQTAPVAVFAQVLPCLNHQDCLNVLTVELDLVNLKISASLIALNKDNRTDKLGIANVPISFEADNGLTAFGNLLKTNINEYYRLGELSPELELFIYGQSKHPIHFEADHLYGTNEEDSWLVEVTPCLGERGDTTLCAYPVLGFNTETNFIEVAWRDAKAMLEYSILTDPFFRVFGECGWDGDNALETAEFEFTVLFPLLSLINDQTV